MSEIPTRLIGPVPSHYSGPTEGDVFAHPGGPCPAWGGYRPVPVDVPLSWLSAGIQELVTQPGTCWGSEGRSLRGSLYRPHNSDSSTLLIHATDGWYIACPARPTRRGVSIALDCLREEWPAGLAQIAGLLPEEVAEAQRIRREGGPAYRAWLPEAPMEEPVLISSDVDIIYRRAVSDDEE